MVQANGLRFRTLVDGPPDGELFIMARRPHSSSKSLTPNANLERLFDGEIVAMVFE